MTTTTGAGTESAEALRTTGAGSGTVALRQELGGFLRAHRDRLTPAEVGLPTTARRRTPGLRREEVAALSGVSVAWYTWLEQGRVETSRQVISAVARALRLDEAAHRHVLTLAGFVPAAPAPEPGGADSADRSRDPLVTMLESWRDSPALLLDDTLTVTASNTACATLWPDFAPSARHRSNLLLLLVGDAACQRALPAWESVAMDLYRHLRTRADTRPHDSRFRALTDRLRAARPDLDHWWDCRSVGTFTSRTVELVQGDGTRPRYRMSLLFPADAPDAAVLVLTPAGP
ncbi:helix-turn-helix domain-containing protein [Streptomyces sp. NPDC087420]|uniref:helix-turn-helix domain-containing protein n=1 Tax=Streptomyces sp. NPDC087420 TaxID=3365785 RepID=UPI0038395F05